MAVASAIASASPGSTDGTTARTSRRCSGERSSADGGRTPRDGLVQRHAQREDVARRAERLAASLLGRHVVAGAHHHARRRQRLADLVETPGDPEIGELRVTAVVEQHVGRLDVAMDDAGRVGRGECRRHLGADPGDVGRRQRSRAGEPFGERSAGDEFHHDVQRPVVGTGVEHGHRVRVDECAAVRDSLSKRCRGAGSAVSRRRVVEHLDGDAADRGARRVLRRRAPRRRCRSVAPRR